ncbi:hypothetical protein ACFVRB_11345 [Streptomyces nojiriensis]|uniref:hypothetical protein n=1 Tax=Streptomyces nojiriensis TaxID=66374 RepID=UPI0036DD5EF4
MTSDDPNIGEITLQGGYAVCFDREDVENVAKTHDPKPIETYAVLVNGRLYGPRQLIRGALNVDPKKIPNSQRCIESLRRLGYPTFETCTYNEAGYILVPDWRPHGGSKQK